MFSFLAAGGKLICEFWANNWNHNGATAGVLVGARRTRAIATCFEVCDAEPCNYLALLNSQRQQQRG
jgi:hypothetical protein